MNGIRHLIAGRISAYPIRKSRAADSRQELRKRQRLQKQIFNPSDRHGILELLKRELQKRPRRNDMERRTLLIEVSQCRQNLRLGLNLIKKQERLAVDYALAGRSLQQGNYLVRILRAKVIPCAFHFFKIDFDHRLEFAFPEQIHHQRGLAHLPCTAHDERLAGGTIFPLPQIA